MGDIIYVTKLDQKGTVLGINGKELDIQLGSMKTTIKANACKFVEKGKKSAKKNITFNAKTGKITVKKNTKKGTYKLKVKVTADGNQNYKSAGKTVTVTVKVKPFHTTTVFIGCSMVALV